MDKIDINNDNYNIVSNESDPLSKMITECFNKLNEIIDWINEQ